MAVVLILVIMENKMSCKILLGAQFGDEGKGKVIDVLAEKSDIIVRYQGGNNAGHTLVYQGKTLVFHLVPSGLLHHNKLCILGNGMVIDLDALFDEFKRLDDLGIKISPENILVSNKAHIILPFQKLMDKHREQRKKDNKIGTTLRGIGPSYEQKFARIGLRVGDLLNIATLDEKLNNIYQYIKEEYTYADQINIDDIESCRKSLHKYTEKLSPMIADISYVLHKSKKAGKRILFEGAQGTMLDIDHGTYPYVTSSNTTAGGACTGAGISPKFIDKVIGVTKAYVTRVGSGYLPTELFDDDGKNLAQIGNEFGATTGRPRRCGWIDLLALRYAVELNGIEEIVLTKLDVLSSFKKIKYCRKYMLDGQEITEFPTNYESLSRAKPIYEELNGWQRDISEVRDFADLPFQARAFVNLIESYLDVKVIMISVGPAREHVIPLV